MEHPASTVITIVLVVGVVLLLGYVIRLRRLMSRRGSFLVSVIQRDQERWTRGIAIFTRESLDWYPTRSIYTRPKFRWKRDEIDFDFTAPSDPDLQIMTLTTPDGEWKLASDPIAVAAIVSWLDSAPPVAEPTD